MILSGKRKMKMGKQNYRIAGHTFSLSSIFNLIHKQYAGYETEEEPEFSIDSTMEKLRWEQAHFSDGHLYHGAYIETLSVYRQLSEHLVAYDTVLFHCSSLAVDGTAYLFTAPSGTGKSTHARLWREYFGDRLVTINDDKPLLHITKEQVTVFGTPYGGKDNLQTNTSAPVGGIIVLHQAPQNEIRRLSHQEAYTALLNQTHRPADVEKFFKTMELVHILADLPVYSMGCTISQEAVELAYNTLKG